MQGECLARCSVLSPMTMELADDRWWGTGACNGMKPDSYLLDWETLSTLGAASFIVTSSRLEETSLSRLGLGDIHLLETSGSGILPDPTALVPSRPRPCRHRRIVQMDIFIPFIIITLVPVRESSSWGVAIIDDPPTGQICRASRPEGSCNAPYRRLPGRIKRGGAPTVSNQRRLIIPRSGARTGWYAKVPVTGGGAVEQPHSSRKLKYSTARRRMS